MKNECAHKGSQFLISQDMLNTAMQYHSSVEVPNPCHLMKHSEMQHFVNNKPNLPSCLLHSPSANKYKK